MLWAVHGVANALRMMMRCLPGIAPGSPAEKWRNMVFRGAAKDDEFVRLGGRRTYARYHRCRMLVRSDKSPLSAPKFSIAACRDFSSCFFLSLCPPVAHNFFSTPFFPDMSSSIVSAYSFFLPDDVDMEDYRSVFAPATSMPD